jgi:hypothetical protein
MKKRIVKGIRSNAGIFSTKDYVKSRFNREFFRACQHPNR